MSQMLTIDGSRGEGGGQILRTSLALSLVTGRPVRLERVRAGRAKPGLLRQHLAAVKAAKALGARVEGAELGSQTLVVEPGETQGGEHTFAVGSAGSACLVLQTVLPPLLAAGRAARLTLEGGTHNPFAPTFDFIERVFLPVLARMGARCRAELDRRGFYPAGGGRFAVEVDAVEGLAPIEILERGEPIGRRATAIISNLPFDIAKRELAVVQRKLGWQESECQSVVEKSSPGPGNVVMLEVESEGVREMCTGFGERRVRAEKVATRAGQELERYLRSSAPVGVRLADQLMVPFAIAGGGALRTLPLSQHARTNLWVIEQFMPGSTRRTETEDEVLIEFGDRP
jgi:RNA 3'-terminal phosphate cyclase (ATP)